MSTIVTADFEVLDVPKDEEIGRLYAYWNEKRGSRAMPSRADIDPTEIAWILPNIFLIEAVPPPDHYRYRVHGSALAEFHRRDFTGLAIHETIAPDDADEVVRVFDAIKAARKPLCATGPVFWCRDTEHKGFESCNLPLSADGDTVNMIFGAIKFGLFKPRVLSLRTPD